ncbi:MAG TPA: sugar phosphate isomerase/epimerase family protein [Planctomycetota bacterium]|nr:sugar phosphate isomerase/epimerase family protein [Planctomycetota bacterium]
MPRVELACSTLNYSNFPFRRALEGIKRAGYEYVGVGCPHETQRWPSPKGSEQQTKECLKLIADSGLKADSALCFETHIGGENSVEIWKREIDLLAELGCKRLITGGPWYYVKWPTEIMAPDKWQAACDDYYRAADQILPHAEKCGSVICIKPHTGLVAHSGRVREVIERLRSPSLKICWDAGNVSFYEGICPDPGLDKIVPHIRAVCLKDHKGPRAHPVFPPLGEGNVDHDEYFGVLAKGGFADVMMIERLGVKEGETLTVEQIDERAKRGIDFLTPLLKKHFS